MTSCRCARTRIEIESAANWQECYHQSVKVFSSFFPCGRQTKIPRFKRLLFLVASFRDRKRMHDCLSLAFEVFPLSLMSNWVWCYGICLWTHALSILTCAVLLHHLFFSSIHSFVFRRLFWDCIPRFVIAASYRFTGPSVGWLVGLSANND